MFGSKKKKDIRDMVAEQQKAAELVAPTPIIAAKMEQPQVAKGPEIAQYVVAEFQKNYMGIIGTKDLEQLDADVLAVNLLFAIYGELRLQRLEREQK